MYAHMTGTTESDEVNQVKTSQPDWHQEHMEKIKELTLPEMRKLSPGRQRLDTGGGYTGTKNQAREGGEGDDQMDATTDAPMQELGRKIEQALVRIGRLELHATSVAQLLDRLDALVGNSVLLIKTKGISMKKFYEENQKIIGWRATASTARFARSPVQGQR